MELPSRLLPYDDAGERMDRLLGEQHSSMHLRYYEEPVELAALQTLHSHFARGPMNRVPARSRVPGARTRWERAPKTADLVYSTEPVASADIAEWVDRQTEAPLDLDHGPTWRLTATAVEGGHTLVALRFHHAVADGLTELRSWEAAAQDEDVVLPVEHGGLAADLKDSARQHWSAAKAIADLARKTVKGGKKSSEEAKPVLTAADLRPSPTAPPEFLPRRAHLEFASADFRAAAAQRGGTTNSLAVGIAARALVATGVVPDGSVFQITQQVRQPDAKDVMGNLSAAASITVVSDATLYEDLRPIRSASKKSFQELQENDLYRLFSIVLQVLPDWLFRKLLSLSKKPSQDLCSVTNVGVTPPASIKLGDATASVFSGWYQYPRTTTKSADWRTYATQIQVALADTGEVTFLGVEGRNPDHHAIPRQAFVDLLVEECARWGLTPRLTR